MESFKCERCDIHAAVILMVCEHPICSHCWCRQSDENEDIRSYNFELDPGGLRPIIGRLVNPLVTAQSHTTATMPDGGTQRIIYRGEIIQPLKKRKGWRTPERTFLTKPR